MTIETKDVSTSEAEQGSETPSAEGNTSIVENSSLAEETNDGTTEVKDEDHSENNEDADDDSDDTSKDLADDDEPIQNMGHLRKVQKANIKLKSENTELKNKLTEKESEFEEYKKQTEGLDVESLTSENAELKAALQEYKNKEVESEKREALKVAGLPDKFLALLKGEAEEWKETLELLAENKTASTSRLGDDNVTNGVGERYKNGKLDPADRKKLARELMSRK